jgi:hypothetical protein
LQDRAESAPLVLGLACRHSQLGANLQALASLLRVSRAVQHAVLDACSGPGNSLQQLDARHLTRLHLTRLHVGVSGHPAAAPLPAALGRLTALRSLSVNGWINSANTTALVREAFGAALQAMPSLTELRLGLHGLYVIPGDMVQHLPTSLVKLQLLLPALGPIPDLQHLTRLQQLQQLELKQADGCDAAALTALSTLTTLQQLSLDYSGGSGNTALLQNIQYGRAWAAMPALKQLHIATDSFAGIDRAIALATRVTCLQLRCDPELPAAFDHATALAPLSQLQRLCVVHRWRVYGGWRRDDDAVPRHDDAVLSAFGSAALQSITHLVWCGVRLSKLACSQLKAASQLQLLILDSRSVDDEQLQEMGCHLGKLHTLGVLVDEQQISQGGIAAAVSGGGFPALRQLVAACIGLTLTSCGRAVQEQLVNLIADVRPDVEVVLLDTLRWHGLSRHSYVQSW